MCVNVCMMAICFPPQRIPEIMNFANFTLTSCLKIPLILYRILEVCKCIMHQLSSINLDLLADTSSMKVIACIIIICHDRYIALSRFLSVSLYICIYIHVYIFLFLSGGAIISNCASNPRKVSVQATPLLPPALIVSFLLRSRIRFLLIIIFLISRSALRSYLPPRSTSLLEL